MGLTIPEIGRNAHEGNDSSESYGADETDSKGRSLVSPGSPDKHGHTSVTMQTCTSLLMQKLWIADQPNKCKISKETY